MSNIRFLYRFLGSKMLVSIIYNTFLVFFLWEIVEKYNSVFLAGLITTISLIIEIVASIPIGHLIDRKNSTRVSLLASLFALSGVLSLFLINSLAVIYTATALISVGFVMKGDSFSATIKKQLHEDQFRYGNTLNQGAIYVASLIGTALGGVSIIYFPHYFSYLLLALALASTLSSFPIPEMSSRESQKSLSSELNSSLSFFRKIIGFLILGFIINGLVISLDVYSSGLFHLVLHASPIFYTLFVAFASLGGVFGAGIAGLLRERTSNAFVISAIVFLFAPLFLILGVSGSAIIDVGVALLIGMAIPLINVPLQTKLMKVVPRRIYGKVLAFIRVFMGGGTPAMAAVLSFVANFYQVNTVLLCLGILLFPTTLFSFLVLPKFMNLKEEVAQQPKST